MSKKVIMTRGLPGSGKSTWAKEFVANHPQFVRVNNDELRLTMFNRVFEKGDTKLVDQMRNLMLTTALCEGKSVVVDNTNLSPKREEEYRTLAKKHGAEFEIKCFLHIPLHECLSNNLKRPNPVNEKVIKGMYRQFVEPLLTPTPVEYVEGLEDVYIFDIDNSLALMGNRSPFDWDKVGIDLPNYPVIKVAQKLSKTDKIIIFSGRDGCCRSETENWLRKYDIPYFELHMRTPNDNRKDSIIKKELYELKIKFRFNVLGVFDDRLQVCDMWWENGLPLFRIGDPRADF